MVRCKTPIPRSDVLRSPMFAAGRCGEGPCNRRDRRSSSRLSFATHAYVAWPLRTAHLGAMRDLFDGIFSNEPLDPTEVARRAMRPQLRRRFYERVEVEGGDGDFRIALDGRPVRTPGRRLLAVRTHALAQALAAEWEAQHDVVDPARMPLTRLANTIIDGVTATHAAVAADVERELACDLVFYRAGGPAGLVARQAKAWDPVLSWAREALGARFALAEGIVFVTQSEHALAAVRAAIPSDPWWLGALHSVTTLTGSA